MCFELNIVEKYDVLKRAFSKRVETKATFTLKSSCLGGKKKEKRMKDGRTNIGNFIWLQMRMQVERM